MTLVFSPFSQCMGKRTYHSKAEAKRWMKRSTLNHSGMSAYRCPHCRSFHIGHKPQVAA